MKKLYTHPLFFLGLALRLILVFGLTPLAVSAWYVPFLDASTSIVTLDPWSHWMQGGGEINAFPYGYAMWLIFLPMISLAKLLGVSLQYAYAATLLIADVCLLASLHKLLPGRQRLLLLAYWLSPVVILASYGLGLNDLVPALLLTLSMLCIRRVQCKTAGALCAAAISAKLSMLVALPFCLVYFYNNKALRQHVAGFIGGCLFAALVFGLPFLFSNAGIQMLLGNSEIGKIYRLTLDAGGVVSVYLVPLVYWVVLYLAWRVKRLNFDLFQATTGMAFLLIALMTPASAGWFIWSIPFLVLYQAMSGRVAMLLIGIFSGLYVLSTLFRMPLLLVNGYHLELNALLRLPGEMGTHAASLLHTTMVAIGVILVLRIWREAISRNDFFRLSRKPFVISVTGDSGAGKDTFANSMEAIFGRHSVVKLSGDDYHLWDRHKPMWQVMTHLNPMANDLEGFCNDLIALADGKSIQSRHYDHQTGKMGKPLRIASNDFIIASGLHALYLPLLRECCSLKVYLDIDEGLRRHFKLQRDVHERGHSVERVLESFKKRESDSERFIRPQMSYADLTLSLQPIHPRMLEGLDNKHPLRLKLIVKTRHGFNELSLNRVLVGVCGLHVDIAVAEDENTIQMTIEGEASAADIAMAARWLCPRALEFLDIHAQWQGGMVGLMQLITLSHISQALTKRFI